MSLEQIKKFKDNKQQIYILTKQNEEYLKILQENIHDIVKKYDLLKLHPHYYNQHNLTVQKKYIDNDSDDNCNCNCNCNCYETNYNTESHVVETFISCKKCYTTLNLFSSMSFADKEEHIKDFYDSFLTYETLYLIHEIFELPNTLDWNNTRKFTQLNNQEWKYRIKNVLDTILSDGAI